MNATNNINVNSFINSVEDTSLMETAHTESDASIAPIVELLEVVFEKFNEHFFESALSKPIVTLSQKGTRKAVGWCTRKKVWEDSNEDRYFEINICPEYIRRPFEDVCEVMLHEICHLSNLQKGIQDCSRSSQYHNKKFKLTAEKHGLIVDKHPSYGFAYTSLKPETLRFIKTFDRSSFDLYRDANGVPETTDDSADDAISRTSSTRKYICPVCDMSVRATKEVNINCNDCNEKMIEQ